MSGSSTFYATLAGRNARESQGWERNAKEWRAYARQLEQDLATWRATAGDAEQRAIQLQRGLNEAKTESQTVAVNAAEAEKKAGKIPFLESELESVKKQQRVLADQLDVAEFQVDQRAAVIRDITETLSRYEELIYDLNASVLALSRRLVGGDGMDFEGIEAAIYAEFGSEAAFNAAIEKEKTPELERVVLIPE